jgi:hypothetical protein
MAQSFQRLPEVFLSDADQSLAISRAVRRGEARKLAPRLYTRNLTDPPEEIVRRNLWPIVALLFPGTVISHRTAIEMQPTANGAVFLSGPYARTVSLPGLTIRQMKGPGPLPGDAPYIQSLHVASRGRAYLEVLRTKTVRGALSPALPRKQVEERLDALIRHGGEGSANALRDQARSLVEDLDAAEAFPALDALIGALLRTRRTPLASAVAKARAAGLPYDPQRTELFALLRSGLANWVAAPRPDPLASPSDFAHLAFADAYFSNFIEGTEFEVAEALSIVFENRIPQARPEDAHDILGTYRLVGSRDEMRLGTAEGCPDADAFLTLLARRHATLMEARADKRPGEWKTVGNQAGRTVFVSPDLVEGTLRQGFEVLRSLTEPFARAAFLMFLITEVHPFDDGNGRLARAMMNAELIAGGERRILIPTAYREDYLVSLRALSRTKEAEPVIRMLDRAQRFAYEIDCTDLQAALALMRACRAFDTDANAVLRLPSELPPA